MSAINGSNGSSVGYIQSIRERALAAKAEAEEAKKKTEAGDTEETSESEKSESKTTAEELAEFKKEFAKTLNSLSGQSHLSMTNVTYTITDEAYEKMMSDPTYKNKVVDYIKGNLNSSYAYPPTKAAFTIDKNGEKVDTSYGALSGMNRGTDILATMNTPNLRMGLTYYKNENLASMLGMLGNGSSGYSNSLNQSLSSLDWLG